MIVGFSKLYEQFYPQCIRNYSTAERTVGNEQYYIMKSIPVKKVFRIL